MPDSAMLDLDFVRPQFPALERGWALFDNAGGSVMPRRVSERVIDYLRRHHVQLGATYAVSAEATALVDAGHRAAEALVGAAPGEVVLGSSTTTNAGLLARALAPSLRRGDEVVVTNLDHEANVGAWRRLERHGVKIREWCFDRRTCRLELADLEPLLTERTRLVCFTHCSNLIGAIHDVPAICRRIRQAGALSCVDGVAFAPHRRVDVKALGADFYFLSLYKVYGPHLGLLWGRRDLLLAAEGQSHFFIGEDEVPYKLEPGSVPHELAASLPGIVSYLRELAVHHGAETDGDVVAEDAAAGDGDPLLNRAFEAIAKHEEALAQPLIDFLGQRRGVRLLGPATTDREVRVPTISFVVEGMPSSQVPPQLDQKGVAIRFGHFYAHRAVQHLGLDPEDGVVRASMVHYNSPAEVERLVDGLDRALPKG